MTPLDYLSGTCILGHPVISISGRWQAPAAQFSVFAALGPSAGEVVFEVFNDMFASDYCIEIQWFRTTAVFAASVGLSRKFAQIYLKTSSQIFMKIGKKDTMSKYACFHGNCHDEGDHNIGKPLVLTFQKGKIPRLPRFWVPHLASKASRYAAYPQRSKQAAAGVWGRSPQRWPGTEPLAGS